MSNEHTDSAWQRWVKRPQGLGFRKLLFQLHLWSAITLGLYIFFISVTGSVLVYRNELYNWVTPQPELSDAAGPSLSDEELSAAALRVYPNHEITRVFRRGGTPGYDAEIWLTQDDRTKRRFFDVNTGEEKGNASVTGILVVSKLIEAHEQFLAGRTGKKINGIAAIAVVFILITGAILWWPGIRRWKQSLIVRRHTGWRRMVWDIHSMTGVWTFLFMLVFAVSGIYLTFPETFHNLAETLQPATDENAGRRLVDRVLYWLAFLHFGRINGIGIPCDGPGLCDQTVKATWAFFGLAPAVMIVTGTLMWWNRSLRRTFKKSSK
jgi:uncharacterized iron-regulated membrane protein